MTRTRLTQPCLISRRALRARAAALASGAALLASAVAADTASGTIDYRSNARSIRVTVKHVYFVKGPDGVTGATIRRLVFANADLGARLKSCTAMTCSDGDLREGLTVDLEAGPRLNYWFVATDQRIQYSGTAPRNALTLSEETPQRVAGQLAIDDSGAGGVKANLTFDATLVKEFAKAR